MKKYICLILLVFAMSCSQNSNQETTSVCPTENLGLTISNNDPFYPGLPQGYEENKWYKQIVGDTLKIHRNYVGDDYGSSITYVFLSKKNSCLNLINVKFNSYNSTLYNPSNFDSNNQPLSFQVQEYTENGVLACKIKTKIKTSTNPNFDITAEDKIWINLGN